MDEKFETACFQIITYVGTARTHFINAIQCAKEGKYDESIAAYQKSLLEDGVQKVRD